MRNHFMTASAAFALGAFACISHAEAVSYFPLDAGAPLVTLAGDVENEEVWQDLRPDITPPAAAVGEGAEQPTETMREPPMEEEGSGGAEEKALKEDGLSE